jgi:hypothetical protein
VVEQWALLTLNRGGGDEPNRHGQSADREKLRQQFSICRREKNAKAKRAWLKFLFSSASIF